MAILRFSITRAKEDWEELERLLLASIPKDRYPNGNGISRFLIIEINKVVAKPKESSQKDKKHQKKNFALRLDDATLSGITEEAQLHGSSVGNFISRTILDPIINSGTTNPEK